jgi:secreted protein with Ig-like and vWFA domain
LIAILLTDGRPTAGTVDSSDIIEHFTAQTKVEYPVFSVGAGSGSIVSCWIC